MPQPLAPDVSAAAGTQHALLNFYLSNVVARRPSGPAHLVAANMDVPAGEQLHDLLQDGLQEVKGALLPSAVHVLMDTPVNRHLSHTPCSNGLSVCMLGAQGPMAGRLGGGGWQPPGSLSRLLPGFGHGIWSWQERRFKCKHVGTIGKCQPGTSRAHLSRLASLVAGTHGMAHQKGSRTCATQVGIGGQSSSTVTGELDLRDYLYKALRCIIHNIPHL